MKAEVSIKIAKLQLLKGLWISKFGFEKSIDELLEAYHIFASAMNTEDNYFGANCSLEIASNYLRQKEISTASAFLNSAVEVFEKLFGEDHPIMQKYYNYSADVYSYAEEHVNMLQMAKKHLEVVEHFNVPSDSNSPQSLFILDALLQLTSMQCQANDHGQHKEEIAEGIARMELICGENGIVDGCQLLHSAYTMKSMTLIKEEKIREALTLLEDTF